MDTRPTVLLFDIDGTILDTGGAGKAAMLRAFTEAGGHPDGMSFNFMGLTDRLIVRTGLRALGLPEDEALINNVLDRYLVLLDEEIPRAKHYVVLPGVREVIAAARKRPMTAVGLGTGNIRDGAMAKLAPVGLAQSFDFGGYGCDAEERVEILRAGASRGAAQLGQSIDKCRLVVIGDTPRDVMAAQGISAQCVAVATGGFSVEELRAARATIVFENMAQPGAQEAILEGIF